MLSALDAKGLEFIPMAAEGLPKSHTASLRQISHPFGAAAFDKPVAKAGRILFEGAMMLMMGKFSSVMGGLEPWAVVC